jgi:serine/threonine protein kinase
MNTLLTRDLFIEALQQPEQDRDMWLANLSQDSREALQPLLEADSSQPDDGGSAEDRYLRASSLVGEADEVQSIPRTDRMPVEQAQRAAEMPLAIGKYRIVSQLGSGAQGSVYRAVHPALNRDVAIKLSHVVSDSASRAALQSEADVLCQLSHPGLATVYDFDFDSGRPFLVMEYVSGQSLEQLAVSGRLTRDQSIDIVIKLCEAMEHAHQHGVIHQDLKPENIVVDDRLQPKVIDFGLANHRNAWTSTDSPFTGGTLAYMSPEQAAAFALPDDPIDVRRPEVDHRTDIFAIGAILYRLLTGKRLYEANARDDGIRAARACRADLDALERCGVGEHVARICRQALSTDKADRPNHCRTVAAALREGHNAAAASRFARVAVAVMAVILTVFVAQFAPDFAGRREQQSADGSSPVVDTEEQTPGTTASSPRPLLESVTLQHWRQLDVPEKQANGDWILYAAPEDFSGEWPITEFDLIRFQLEYLHDTHSALLTIPPAGEVLFEVAPVHSAGTNREAIIAELPEGQVLTLDYGTGQHTFVVLYSEHPLPSETELLERVPSLNQRVSHDSGIRQYEKGRIRGATRSPGSLPGSNNLAKLCDEIENACPDVRVYAVTFPVVEGEAPETPAD